MYAGIYTNGLGTLRSLNAAYAAFEEMQSGPYSDIITNKCREYMNIITRTKQRKTAVAGGAIVTNVFNVLEPGRAAAQKWARPQASQKMRDRAWDAHNQIVKDIA